MRGFILWSSLLLLIASVGSPQVLAEPNAAGANSPAAAQPGSSGTGANEHAAVKSGVYGFSGGQADDDDPKGVVGECIWIFDQNNRSQLAKGNCPASDPGTFRVKLKPGKYVIHGPGGNRPIEVKAGQWVRVVSIVKLPVGF